MTDPFEPFPCCPIPSTYSLATHCVQNATPIPKWSGNAFCGAACPDIDLIPDKCKATCDFHRLDNGGCAFAIALPKWRCPCGSPVTPTRLAAFAAWVVEREKEHHDPKVNHQMAREMGRLPQFHVGERRMGHGDE